MTAVDSKNTISSGIKSHMLAKLMTEACSLPFTLCIYIHLTNVSDLIKRCKKLLNSTPFSVFHFFKKIVDKKSLTNKSHLNGQTFLSILYVKKEY